MTNRKSKLKREIWVCAQYSFISFLAAILALDRFIVNQQGPNAEAEAINIEGMMITIWNTYLIPWSIVFFSLSALRIMTLLMRMRTSDNQEGVR